MRKILMILLALTMLCGCSTSSDTNKDQPDANLEACEVSDVAWYDQYRVIGHAFGYIDGLDYIGTIRIPVLNLNLPVISEWDYKKMKTFPSILRTEYAYALLAEKDLAKAEKIKGRKEEYNYL